MAKQKLRNEISLMSIKMLFLTGTSAHPSIDPGPDVIQVVLSPRPFLNSRLSMPGQDRLTPNMSSSYSGYNVTSTDTAFRNSILPGSLNQCSNLTSSTSTSSQIPPHQLRELVRERLTAEGIRLSAPPYTIPTVR